MGLFLSWILAFSIGKATGWATEISLNSVILSFSFSASIGIIFGIYPARKASMLNPIDALRYE